MTTNNIITCKNCPRKTETNHWSSDEWDAMCDWVCNSVPEITDNNQFKVIAKCVEWHEESGIQVPDWCPLTQKQIVIKSPSAPTLPNRYTIEDLMEAFKAGNKSFMNEIKFEEWFHNYTNRN